MANVYVRSGAAGAGTGADWTNAFTTLAAAFTAKAAGDSFWVADDHAETAASAKTLTSPGTNATPCFVYCVNRAGSVPPVSADLRTTATISTTGANSISFAAQHTYWYGIIFQAGDSTNAASINLASGGAYYGNFKSCGFTLNNTASGSRISLTGSAITSRSVYDNCTWTFGSNASQAFLGSQADGITIIRGGSVVVGATVPTTLIGSATASLFLEGVDLSALGSGKTLVGANTTNLLTNIKDCKLGVGVTIAATPTNVHQEVNLIRSDASGTNYRTEKYHFAGTQTVETTIVRTGGASDGTTSISWNITTTANSKWVLPFEAMPIAIWNDTAGSPVTVTLYGIWGGGAVPNTDDIWMDVEYLGASGNPQGAFISASKADNLAAGSAHTTDTSTWGGSTTKFKMSVTFTPQQKGAMYIYVKAAKASSTFYIDPKPVVS